MTHHLGVNSIVLIADLRGCGWQPEMGMASSLAADKAARAGESLVASLKRAGKVADIKVRQCEGPCPNNTRTTVSLLLICLTHHGMCVCALLQAMSASQVSGGFWMQLPCAFGREFPDGAASKM